MPTQVHCLILRKVKAGRERDFEAALKRFIQRSMEHSGTTGAHLLFPPPGDSQREYGVMRSFPSAQQRDEFYQSELFRQWEEEAAEFVEGDAQHHELSGMEAFFRQRGLVTSPPKWKMALLTWLGVWPCVLLWSTLLRTLTESWHPVLRSGLVTAAVVPTLAWVVMPLLTKLFRKWLS